jgi:hypothetical protein
VAALEEKKKKYVRYIPEHGARAPEHVGAFVIEFYTT